MRACPECLRNYFVIMQTKIVPIGNSRGIRIPKALLDDCGFDGEADMVVKNGTLILRPIAKPRAGWAEAFQGMADAKEDFLVHEDAPVATQFDAEDWEW